MPFLLIPVIDILNGQAVHAVRGQRDHYRPIRSCMHPSSEPVALTRAVCNRLGLSTVYLADLDAIQGRPANLDVIERLAADGLHLWVDIGMREAASATQLAGFDRESLTIIAGLETVSGPSAVRDLVTIGGPDRLAFSLDLFEGRARIAEGARWPNEDPRAIAAHAVAAGVRRLIILDLARVGSGEGLGSGDLVRQVREDHPSVQLVGGGGLSSIEEVTALRAQRVDAVLIGSAIHDGRIGQRELACLND
jgi:phosphoribosylformimino-5-aminoimidazole carboxamide ribotide isomerase